MDGLLNMLPLQVSTLLKTVGGDKSPLTAQDLGDTDKQRIAEAIMTARAYRQGLLDAVEKQAPLQPSQMKAYKKFFPNQKAIDYFKAGGGTINYGDYADAGQATSDWDMTPSGSIRNTLGQFVYNVDKKGNINIKEGYDYLNDTVSNLPKDVARSSRYEKMSAPEKALTVAKETFYMPQVGFSPKMGITSLPSRFGNAFVGKSGKPVDISFPSPMNVNPTDEIRNKTLMNLLGVKY